MFSVFQSTLPPVADRIAEANPNISATGAFESMFTLSPSVFMSFTSALLWFNSLDASPMSSCGVLMNTFCIGSSITGSEIVMEPYIAFLAAGITCAGPLCIASSWSLASTSLTSTPWHGSDAVGPLFITSSKASLMSSLVSNRYCIPLVVSAIKFNPCAAKTPFASSFVIPSSCKIFATSFLCFLTFSGITLSCRALTIFSGSGSTSM